MTVRATDATDASDPSDPPALEALHPLASSEVEVGSGLIHREV